MVKVEKKLTELRKRFGQTLDKAEDKLDKFADSPDDALDSFFTKIGRGAEDLFDKAEEVVTGNKKPLSHTIGKKIDRFVEDIEKEVGTFSKISDTVANFFKNLLDSLKEIFSELKDLCKSAFKSEEKATFRNR